MVDNCGHGDTIKARSKRSTGYWSTSLTKLSDSSLRGLRHTLHLFKGSLRGAFFFARLLFRLAKRAEFWRFRGWVVRPVTDKSNTTMGLCVSWSLRDAWPRTSLEPCKAVHLVFPIADASRATGQPLCCYVQRQGRDFRAERGLVSLTSVCR